MIQRLNPGPGLVDFWTEFKRPNPYRWPILGGSALLTASLMFLLTDHAVNLNWVVGGVLALIGGVVLTAVIAERVHIHLGVLAAGGADDGRAAVTSSPESTCACPRVHRR